MVEHRTKTQGVEMHCSCKSVLQVDAKLYLYYMNMIKIQESVQSGAASLVLDDSYLQPFSYGGWPIIPMEWNYAMQWNPSVSYTFNFDRNKEAKNNSTSQVEPNNLLMSPLLKLPSELVK
ncbi:hypothetical protein GOBAR_AA21108 [Gossypium barbadense]|uniref:Uncharacterized protein n=1 Tax=Gossypium barbadense TaxID=3634 RepID=A0A2P5X885_GOSBA|nr:hypothetical protein GOBAR_AA21108 [Gossypium barbadense]